VQFCTKFAILILICAVLTAYLSGELTALPQASWLDSVEERRMGKLRGKGEERKWEGKRKIKGGKKWEGDKWDEKGKEGKGKGRKGRNVVQL